MKISFSLKDPTKLKGFLSVESPFIDVLITTDKVYFCSIRSDIYGQIAFDIITRHKVDGLHTFRIDKKVFLSLIEESIIGISMIGDGKVLMEIEPKGKSPFAISFTHQQSDISAILDYQNILGKFESFRPINLTSLKSKISLMRAHDGVITINNGIIKMEAPHINTFIKTAVEDLAVQSIFLKYLIDFTEDIFVYRNSIIGVSDNVSIICSQAIPEFSDDFNYMKRAKNKSKYVVDFTPIIRLVARHSSEVDFVNVDLKNRKAYFDMKDVQMSTLFHSENMDEEVPLTEDDLLGLLESPPEEIEEVKTKFRLPMRLIKDFIPKATPNLTIEIKTRFLVLSNDRDIFFVVGRSSYE